MRYFVGLDVALRSVALCVVDGDGEIVLERALACEVDEIVTCLTGFGHPIERIGFEAGTMSQTLFHGLQASGYDVVCMEARHVSAALSAMRNKTDRNDARGIAQVLRSGWYRPVHMKSLESHHVRTLLTSRKALLRRCIDLENEIRGLFKVFGIRLPPSVPHHRFAETVRPIIEADEALAYALLPMLDAQQVLLASYQELDRRVKLVARQDPICDLLMTAPGVGAVTALHFKAAIDDPSRFTSSRIVGAHFGLTPRRFQSGESDSQGRISKAGDGDVRSALYSAAHSLLTRSRIMSPLKAWGMHLIKTKGRRRATVAVARKLAVILHRMWMDGTPFQWNDQEVNV
jgi:transposase